MVPFPDSSRQSARSRSEGGITRRDLLAGMAAAALGLRGSGAANAAPIGSPGPQEAVITRRIPSSGENLPVIGLGTWQTFDVGGPEQDRAPLRQVLREFVELGGRMVDSSPMYGRAESVAGDLIRELNVRDRVFIATKVWTRGRQQGEQQMRSSLQRFHAQSIELMQVHNLLDVQEHLATMREWKSAGRFRYIGVTHSAAGAYDALERVLANETLDFVQLNYSLVEREAERRLLPLAQDRGIAVIVNRPFAEGALFSRVRGRQFPDFAADTGARSWAQLFLKWIVGHPAVTCVIPATSNPEHLRDNMAAMRGAVPDTSLRDRIATALQR